GHGHLWHERQNVWISQGFGGSVPDLPWRAPMGTSQRSLLVLGILGAIAPATPVSAETRPVRTGADRVAQAPNDAKYRRAAFMPTGRRRPAGGFPAFFAGSARARGG